MADLPGRLDVEIAKVADYLLALDHRRGKSKARFFHGIGFHRERPEELAEALMNLARSAASYRAVSSAFGTKYIVDGEIRGRTVRTTWMVKPLDPLIRLVSAYPIRRRR